MEIKSYLDWESVIPLDEVFAKKNSIRNTSFESNDSAIFWQESKADGTVVINRYQDGIIKQVSPEGMNVRSMVHEYGGKNYTVFKQTLYFSNLMDQRLYCLDLETEEYRAITPENNSDGSKGRYACPNITESGKTMIFVYEKAYADRENENYIACLRLDGELREPTILSESHDFYADPKIHGSALAWMAWKKPFMPWESCQLFKATFNEDSLQIDTPQLITNVPKVSVSNYIFDKNGNIYFIADYYQKLDDDPLNWWNIYKYSYDKVSAITKATDREYGVPQWGLGNQILDIDSEGKIIAKFNRKGMEKLVSIDPNTLEETPYELEKYTILGNFQVTSQGLLVSASTSYSAVKILRIDMDSFEVLYSVKADDKEYPLIEAEFLSYPTKGGDTAHLYYYAPSNPSYKAPDGEKPPVLVQVHGGPTGNTSNALSMQYQYILSSGFAIIDLDHRGSTGYGRRYRDKLEGQWGIVEMEDLFHAIEYFKQKDLISDRIFISGGSAGGYSVQRALTLYPDLFTAGASYFGIGNLFTLINMALEHHKFEAYYGVYLFGGMPDEVQETYKERSPMFHIDQLKTPMILFHGLDDRVVHPENSREIAKVLQEKGIKHKLIEFEGEGHGFRNINNRKDSFLEELAFYREVIRG
ncbi:MAG: S9 family peptidase [Candidatus Heimdallarchaeota archaeon]|nr:S9 family peptidase [Candidatus Heimdallarchaeota archaeon]